MATTFDYVADSEVFVAPDTITVTNEGVVFGNFGHALDLSGGIFTVTINGIVNGNNGNDGIKLGTVSGTTASKIVVGANGQLNSDSAYSLESLHAVNLTNSGIMDSWSGISIDGKDTSFAIINSGVISTNNGMIELLGTAKAVHTITNNEVILADIDANQSFGADKLTSNGLIDGYVDLGEGANYFISKGYVNGNITMGSALGTGIDTFLNYNIVNGSVDLGGGNDVMTNNLTIKGTVSLGAGNDKFTNAGEVKGGSAISMGADDDTFVSGKYQDWIIDEDGKDSYDLGDGQDYFAAVGTGSASLNGLVYDIDTVNGGAQTGADLKKGIDSIFGDVYDAFDATGDIVMNLDSAKRYDVVNGALSTDTKAAYTATGAEIGTDVIKGFEEFFLGKGNDLVFGTVNADKIWGGDGTDTIYGGKGNDYLLGGADADKIIGEAGRDLLQGDAGADIFIYRAIADSTLAFTGRDRIMDFTDGSDIIDLSNLSTTTITFGGVDQNFNDTVGVTDAPEIRVLTTSFGYTIQVDTTGDNKADFAIDIENAAHNITWTGADFVL